MKTKGELGVTLRQMPRFVVKVNGLVIGLVIKIQHHRDNPNQSQSVRFILQEHTKNLKKEIKHGYRRGIYRRFRVLDCCREHTS